MSDQNPMKMKDATSQASSTAYQYMREAVDNIASYLGAPEPTQDQREHVLKNYGPIIAGMVQAAAQDFHTTALARGIGDKPALQDLLMDISRTIDNK